jgi:cell division protein FtsQ
MTATANARRRAGQASARRHGKSRRPWRRMAFAGAAIVVVLTLFGGTLWIVYFSTALVTKRVTVVGTRNLTPTQVSFAVQIPLGVPLARQNLDEIATRARTLPVIETATAKRDWPNTITVTVVERRPVFAVQQPNEYVVVDKLGVPYQRQRTRPGDVVLAKVNPGDAPLLTEVATVAAVLPAKLRGKADLITANGRDNIVLILASGAKVTWGNATDSELKAQIVTALLKRQPKLSSIDVSSPHTPAVRA